MAGSRGNGNLVREPTSGGVPTGTTMPGSPTTNQMIFRTDLGLQFYFDGTRWLTTNEYRYLFPVVANQAGAINPAFTFVAVPSVLDIYVTRFAGSGTIITTNNASNFWTFNLQMVDTSTSRVWSNLSGNPGFDTHLWTASAFTLGADAAANVAVHAATNPLLGVSSTATGSPGVQYVSFVASFRMIGV